MSRLERLGWLVAVFALLLLANSSITQAAGDPQKDLEQTVRRFYDAYINSKWKTAEKFVDSESREVFRSQPKPGILKYQIGKIEMKEGGKEALVTVGVDQPVQIVGKALTLNAQTQWRLVKGNWYLFIAAPPPIPTMMAAVRPTSDNPTMDLKFDYREFDFGRKRQGDQIKIAFPFTNATDHPVRVTASLISDCNCIEVGVSKEIVAPGEKANVWFQLNSEPFTFYYHQGIGVTVEPGGGKAILDIFGLLVPAEDNPLPSPNANVPSR